jgi:hypothetical protein
MSKPLDLDLYNKVKEMANKKFKSPTGIYRSMWISKRYTDLGGLYDKPKSKTKSKVVRWLDEKWVDMNQPILRDKQIVGYKKCGTPNKQNNLYPLCRPSKRITKDSPKTYQEIGKKKIEKANKLKQILKNEGNTIFG